MKFNMPWVPTRLLHHFLTPLLNSASSKHLEPRLRYQRRYRKDGQPHQGQSRLLGVNGGGFLSGPGCNLDRPAEGQLYNSCNIWLSQPMTPSSGAHCKYRGVSG
ncbi:hypothetical protein B0H10DRAFT_2005475 [Mycena sp. CBHHK59/15]|nr:hypothetical protein B0H10DRAFT_2005475 [Mycena sp. CBHHK59/15]